MDPNPGRLPALPILFAALLAGVPARTAVSQVPATGADAAAAKRYERDAELGRRLEALLGGKAAEVSWSISIEAADAPGGILHRLRLWSDGLGIWDGESQFRLDERARREVLQTFHDNGFCRINDDLEKPGSGVRKEQNAVVREHFVTLEIGGVSKTVSHIVSTWGRYPDVEGAAEPLREIVRAARKVCQEPAAKGTRAKDLADGLAKVADGRLADATFSLLLSRPQEPDGSGWMTRIEGRRVEAQVSTKGKGWAPAVSIGLTREELLALVRTIAAAGPAAFPKNLYDDGYTDFVLTVLDRTASVQARHFAGKDPKAQAEVRKSFQAVVDAVRSLHERAVAEGRRP